MAIERTFSIIKPNAVKKNVIGDIIHTFESKGLKVAAAKLTMISKEKCELFYANTALVHFLANLLHL